MQRIYFPEISGTQRKSIIEVRQVLSKCLALRREFCALLLRAKGVGRIPLAGCQNDDSFAMTQTRRRKRGRRKRKCVKSSEYVDMRVHVPRKRSNFLVPRRGLDYIRTQQGDNLYHRHFTHSHTYTFTLRYRRAD